MTITDMSNLFVAYNENENFRVLVCAMDEDEALQVACGYAEDAGLSSNADDWQIKEFTSTNENFDCDYVISASDTKL